MHSYSFNRLRDWREKYVFFFQAEDGIRDLVRSRGLGDVYTRQSQGSVPPPPPPFPRLVVVVVVAAGAASALIPN